MSKPMTATAAKNLANQFAETHAKGGILGTVFAAFCKKLLAAFIESLLKDYNIIPKETA